MTNTKTWTPTISDAEIRDFREWIDTTLYSYERIDATAYFNDVATRYFDDVWSYAEYISADGFTVTVRACSGARCSVFVTMPNGEDAGELFEGIIPINYYAGQVDYREVLDESLSAAKRGWMVGPDGRREIRAQRLREALLLLDNYTRPRR